MSRLQKCSCNSLKHLLFLIFLRTGLKDRDAKFSFSSASAVLDLCNGGAALCGGKSSKLPRVKRLERLNLTLSLTLALAMHGLMSHFTLPSPGLRLPGGVVSSNWVPLAGQEIEKGGIHSEEEDKGVNTGDLTHPSPHGERRTMVNLVWYLRDRLSHLLDLDQRGIETLEWILIGAIVCGVAATTYGLLEGGLDTAVQDITTFISGQVP
jgi:hypothetical protein